MPVYNTILASGDTHTPLTVADATARKALTGLANGAVVQEVGVKKKWNVTFGTKLTPFASQVYFQLQNPVGVYIVVSGEPTARVVNDPHTVPPIFGYVLANATPMSGEAFALAAYNGLLLTSASNYFNFTLVGASIVVESKLAGYTNGMNDEGINGCTLTVISSGLKPGSTYRVIDNTKLDSDDGWELVDIANRNALVPSNASILPPQAYVNYYGQLCNSVDWTNIAAGAFNFSASGISFIDPIYVGLLANYYGGYLSLINGSMPVSNVGNILSAASGAFSAAIDISGGTTASPLDPACDGYYPATFEAAQYSFDLTNLDPNVIAAAVAIDGSLQLIAVNSAGNVTIDFRQDATFASSSGLSIGCSDLGDGVTVADIADYIEAHASSFVPATLSRNGLVFSFIDEANIPYSSVYQTVSDLNLQLINVGVQGPTLEGNSYCDSIKSNGSSVTANAYPVGTGTVTFSTLP